MSAYCTAFAMIVLAVYPVSGLATIVLDFEDLDEGYTLTGSGYAGLTWEEGNEGVLDDNGFWGVSPALFAYPHSGIRNVSNAGGCTLIGISFPDPVHVYGAYFGAQGGSFGWTTGIRVHAYLDGSQVSTSDWFTEIDETPDWFAMDLINVDRIVIETQPVTSTGFGWFGMDDLTYSPEPSSMILLVLSALIAVRQRT